MQTVTFAMTECEATRGPGGGQELALELRTAHPQAEAAWLRNIRIGGVRPDALLALRLCTGVQSAFVLEACHDRVGRTIAAGDLVAAIFGPGQGRWLQVTAEDFLRPLAASAAGAHLRLQGGPGTAVAAITVEGDSW